MTEPVQIEQIQAMRMGVDYKHVISIRDFKVQVRPLAMTETLVVAQNVSLAFEKLPVEGRTRLAEHLLLAKETLKMASKPDYNSTVEPALTDYVMNLMTNDELSYLHKQYVSVMDKVNPALEELPVEEVKTMVEEVKKNPLAVIELSFLEVVNMVRFLVTKEDSLPDK